MRVSRWNRSPQDSPPERRSVTGNISALTVRGDSSADIVYSAQLVLGRADNGAVFTCVLTRQQFNISAATPPLNVTCKSVQADEDRVVLGPMSQNCDQTCTQTFYFHF